MLHQRDRFLMRDEHVDHPVLQHLEGAERRRRTAFASWSIPASPSSVRRSRRPLRRRARAMARSRQASSAATPSPSSPSNSAPTRTSRRLISAARRPSMVLKLCRCRLAARRSTTNRLTPPRSRAITRGARGDDQIIRPGRARRRRPSRRSGRSRRPRAAPSSRHWRDRKREPFSVQASAQIVFPATMSGMKRLLLRRRIPSLLDQAAGEHHRLDERLDHEVTAELLHDDHGRQRAAAEPADVFRERRGQASRVRRTTSHCLRLKPSSLATILRRASKSYWSRSRRCTLERNSSCSSVNWISIRFPRCVAVSETEHRFGDDVALDLVRSAVDAELARVQIFLRRRVAVVGTRHEMVGARPDARGSPDRNCRSPDASAR